MEMMRRADLSEIDILIAKVKHGARVGQDEPVFRMRENDCRSGRSSHCHLDGMHPTPLSTRRSSGNQPSRSLPISEPIPTFVPSQDKL